LLDRTGRQLAGQLRRSPPTATVVVGFIQTYKPVVESSSSAHTAEAASAGAASAGAASADAASAGAASAGAASAGAASAGAASAGTASAGAASAGAASAGAASAGAASTEPVAAARERAASAAVYIKLPSRLSAAALSAGRTAGKQNPAQLRVAYSRLLDDFPAVVCASKPLPPVSHDVVHHIVTHGSPIASKFRKLDG
jgi:hypothetical protein